MFLAVNCLDIDMKWVTVPTPISKTETPLQCLLGGCRHSNLLIGNRMMEWDPLCASLLPVVTFSTPLIPQPGMSLIKLPAVATAWEVVRMQLLDSGTI